MRVGCGVVRCSAVRAGCGVVRRGLGVARCVAALVLSKVDEMKMGVAAVVLGEMGLEGELAREGTPPHL